jgi:hypothetical protein
MKSTLIPSRFEKDMTLKRIIGVYALALILVIGNRVEANGNIFSNEIEAVPNFATSIDIYLIDLSQSVDKNVIKNGLAIIQSKIADAYQSSRGKYSTPAKAYFFWLPIRGVSDQKDFLPLFNSQIDKNIWIGVRNSVGGRTNQIQALEKIRSEAGVWSELIRAKNLNGCVNFVAEKLSAPGLFGKSLLQTSKTLCVQAIYSRNNYQKMQKAVELYLSGKVKNLGGSDILGAVARLDSEISSDASLGKYKKINLIFVTDGVHNTPALKLHKILPVQFDKACQLGQEKAKIGSKYDPARVSIKMYGIGEGRSENAMNNEQLQIPLKEFWKCFWSKKGIVKSDFAQLNELGVS